MVARKGLSALGSVFVLTIVLAASRCSRQPGGKTWLLGCPVDQATAVRFFYNPEGAGYFHFPLVLRVVPSGDPRLNTAPMRPEGRTAYITRGEMRAMLRALAQSGASWRVSSKVEPLGDFHGLVRFHAAGPPYLSIEVVCSRGTARGEVDPTRICSTLAPLDSALKTPRALWEFQFLRIGYGCTVPRFNMRAYPERR